MNTSPSAMPVCYTPAWNDTGNFLVTIIYNCGNSMNCPAGTPPPEWMINVRVSENPLDTKNIIGLIPRFNVYPNPFISSFTVQLNQNGLKPAMAGEHGDQAFFEMRDFLERKVLSKQISKMNTQVFSPSVSPGLYFYRISDENNNILYSGKIIKEK